MTIAAAQLGPIQLDDTRESAVNRLVDLFRTAADRGAELVVFPELAFTTFFPRWWFDDEAEVEHRFFEASMPSPATQPLFDTAAELGVGFTIGYAELADERRFNTSILVGPDGSIVGKYRKVHLPGHADHKPDAAFQHLEKRYFEVGDLGFPVYRYPGTGTGTGTGSRGDGSRGDGHPEAPVIGMLICNDRRWPEAFRVLGLQGAEIVTLGFNTPVDQPPLPRTAGPTGPPAPRDGPSDGQPERRVAGRDGKGRLRGRVRHVRELGDRRPNRRDRGQDQYRG